VVTVAGPVSHGQVVDLAASRFAALRAGPTASELPPPPPPRGPWFRHIEHDEAQTEFRLLFPTVPEQHPDHAPLQLLRRIIDDGLSSRLPFNVVEKRGLAYSVHANLEVYPDCGFFEIDAACAPEKAGRVVEAALETLAELCDGKATLGELRRAQRRYRMFLDFAADAPGDLAAWFGGTELFRRPESFEERARLIEAQSLEDIQRVARTYLRKSALCVVAVGQNKGVRALEKAACAAAGLPD
ncbi:MAG: insulinase family protein, partial [Myxococcaceae bacterium]|nr:insulinase family protein [Myxococcaceae bacterium]